MTLISIFLKSSILMLVAAVTNIAAGRRLSAATRHFITLVIAGLLLLPVLSLLLPPWTAFTTAPNRTFEPLEIEQDAVSAFTARDRGDAERHSIFLGNSPNRYLSRQAYPGP